MITQLENLYKNEMLIKKNKLNLHLDYKANPLQPKPLKLNTMQA